MAIAVTSVLCLLSACGPARQAYFQPDSRPYARVVSVNSVSLTEPSSNPTDLGVSIPAMPSVANSQSASVAAPVQRVIHDRPSKRDILPHFNPDSEPVQQLNRHTSLSATEHVALPSYLIDRHSPNRKTHKLALLALGIAILSYGSLLLTGGSTLLWVLSITMPLTATMLGASSLLTINRHKDRYRGKGWAMAAIVIGTGAVGLALMAVAALSVSKMMWEK